MLRKGLKLAVAAASNTAGAVIEANEAIDSMIDNLKSNENITINRIGRVLEGTKFGFLLGYVTPSILLATGVVLTTGDIIGAVGGGIAVLSNPVAGVCAAVGAIYFGWKALSESERDAVLEQVGSFLKVGFEMIKSVINFALNLMKDLLSADNIAELKQTVSDAAEIVGRHISDITHAIKDKFDKVADTVSKAASSAGDTVSKGAESASNTFSKGADAVSDAASSVADSISSKFKKDEDGSNKNG